MKKAYLALISISAVILAITGAAGLLARRYENRQATLAKSHVREVKRESLDGSPITGISIRWITGDVTVLPSEDGVIGMVEQSDELSEDDAFTSRVENGVLHIESNPPLQGRVPKSSLILYLPQKDYASLALETSTASAEISGFSFEDVNIHTSTGAIRLLRSQVKTAQIKASTGMVTLESAAMPQKIRCNISTGNCVLRLPDSGGILLRQSGRSENIKSQIPLVAAGTGQEPVLDLTAGIGTIQIQKYV